MRHICYVATYLRQAKTPSVGELWGEGGDHETDTKTSTDDQPAVNVTLDKLQRGKSVPVARADVCVDCPRSAPFALPSGLVHSWTTAPRPRKYPANFDRP